MRPIARRAQRQRDHAQGLGPGAERGLHDLHPARGARDVVPEITSCIGSMSRSAACDSSPPRTNPFWVSRLYMLAAARLADLRPYCR